MPAGQTIGLDQLSQYFHLPINDVAKELGVCATVLKKICRKNGIPRWPHRKIKSLDKMISSLEAAQAKNPEDGERIKQEIVALKSKKSFLMHNPNALASVKPAQMKRHLHRDQDSQAHAAAGAEAYSAPEVLDDLVRAGQSMINSLAAALYVQMVHPPIPHPLRMAVPPQPYSFAPMPQQESQWSPSDSRPSAFSRVRAVPPPSGTFEAPPCTTRTSSG
eukprot:TRINITY_DN12834_c1_g1_i2.p1 TRINITY_DN12834_c1_g1~~TRINITY_DN12834_c1_g1_i2.p1  ORF type:complete len:219 (+),score=59.92 TRINITY_DN12834_c1_g1_i2:49-705(+)